MRLNELDKHVIISDPQAIGGAKPKSGRERPSPTNAPVWELSPKKVLALESIAISLLGILNRPHGDAHAVF